MLTDQMVDVGCDYATDTGKRGAGAETDVTNNCGKLLGGEYVNGTVRGRDCQFADHGKS